MSEPFSLSLRQAARQIGAGSLSSNAYTRSLLLQISQLEPDVQAFQWLDTSRALRLAADADERAKAGKAKGALQGVPLGVKDIIFTAGIPTAMGSVIYRDYVPDADADLVRRLKATGACVQGKTVTTEFAFMVPAKTRNPWNLAHTPGGSSSGSAAAVAAGFTAAAIGTQTNGSVIRPAAFCGVVGYKPGKGALSTDGILPFSPTLDQPGVFARCVADAALLASLLATRRGAIDAEIGALAQGPRLAAVRTPVWTLAQEEARSRFAADIAALRGAGAQVDEVDLPAAFDEGHAVHRSIMLHEGARVSAQVRAAYRAKISDTLNSALEEGDKIADTAYMAALIKRRALEQHFAELLGRGYDAVIALPAAGEAPASLQTTGDPSFCTLWTLLGVPAITIPTGLGPRGLPLGLQIVAGAGEEDALLAVAAWCEQALPFKTWIER